MPTISKLNSQALAQRLLFLDTDLVRISQEQDVFKYLWSELPARQTPQRSMTRFASILKFYFTEDGRDFSKWREFGLDDNGHGRSLERDFWPAHSRDLREAIKEGKENEQEFIDLAQNAQMSRGLSYSERAVMIDELRRSCFFIHAMIKDGPAELRKLALKLEPIFMDYHPLSISRFLKHLVQETKKDPVNFVRILFKQESSTNERESIFAGAIEALHELSYYAALLRDLENVRKTFAVPIDFPVFEDRGTTERPLLSVENGHLLAKLFNRDGKTSVGNNFLFDSEHPFTFILRGPNGQGKSTFMRMLAQMVVMAQLGLPVPATSMRLTPLRLLVHLPPRDNILTGDSRFRAEAKQIWSQTIPLLDPAVGAFADPYSLVLIDEPLNSTTSQFASAAEIGLLYRQNKTGAIVMFATHKETSDRLAIEHPDRFANIHVDHFNIRHGPLEGNAAINSAGIGILRDAGWDEETIAIVGRVLKKLQ